MKKSTSLSIIFLLFIKIIFAQDSESVSSVSEGVSGIIKYEQFNRFDVSVFGEDSKVVKWLSGMPTGRLSAKALFFTNSYSLYENDLSDNIVIDSKAQVMTEKIAYLKPPMPEVRKVYMDLSKNKITEQVELMTRFFIIEKDIEALPWKTGSNQRKIQGYICHEGISTRGEETIIAWFTPEIPVSFGPENYRGLPGMILAIDINGENVILATSIDIDAPMESTLVKPNDGKKIKQETFDQIVADKADEFRKIQKSKVVAKKTATK